MPGALDQLDATYDTLGSFAPRRRKRHHVASLETTPAQKSILKKLGASTLSGLAAVGNLIDLPWSMGRDVLAGENPLDQLLSPFSFDNRTSGRKLLETWGVLGRNKPGLDWGDVAGFGVEVADPFLLPFSFGSKALGLAGRAAKAAGRGFSPAPAPC